MKKLLTILLFMLYSFTAIGATVNIHFCMEEYVGASFFTVDDDACFRCGMKEKGGCCRAEEKQVKPNIDNQQVQAVEFSISANESIIDRDYTNFTPFHLLTATQTVITKPNPPPLGATPLYKLYGVFRI